MNGPLECRAPSQPEQPCAHVVAAVERNSCCRPILTPTCVPTTRPSNQIGHFATVRPRNQFDQLVEAIQREHPSKAAQMREWSVAAQHGLLMHLASMTEQTERGAVRVVARA